MTPEQVLAEAERRFRAGDALGAERTLATLWADTSKAPAPAVHLLGLIRRGQRRILDAERYFRRAIELEPNGAHHHFALGDLLSGAGFHTHAADAFARACALAPQEIVYTRAHAICALTAGRFDDAENAARRFATASPSAEAWELLANALHASDKLEAALAAIGKALTLEPNRASAAHARAVILSKIGRNEEALNVLDALEARGVSAPAIALSRGTAYFNLSRTEESEATFAGGVARWPTDSALQSALANARWMRGDGETFARDFEAAVARQPDDIRLRLGCADLLRRADMRGRAEDLLRAGLQRAPEDVALLQSLGVLLDEMDRTSEGVPLLQRAVARAPQYPPIRANLAFALLRLGRGDEALREIGPARTAEPLHQEWICCETMALRQLGDARYHELCDYEKMVRAFDLPAPRGFANMTAFNEALSASLSRLHALEAHPLDQSLRGGSQTSRSLIYVEDETIQAYLAALREPIQAYIDSMGPPDPNHPWSGRKSGNFRLSGAWSVKLRANGYHINHLHPAGWISSAYYVALPKAVSEASGQQGWIKFGEPRWPTPRCTVEKVVQPQEGRLVLFPSYMWHGTIPFSAGERLTAPFDVVPV